MLGGAVGKLQPVFKEMRRLLTTADVWDQSGWNYQFDQELTGISFDASPSFEAEPTQPGGVDTPRSLRGEVPKTTQSKCFGSLHLIRRWLQDCDSAHPCNKKEHSWPTRLLFIGDPDLAKLQLWETVSRSSDLPIAISYVALSHCWGGPTDADVKRFCTTKANYRRRLRGFSIDELPRTFQDAVQVARATDMDFLWIDALCIIQMDYSDWQNEARCMEDVFSGAYFTIAASSAMNWQVGFLEEQPHPSNAQVQMEPGKWEILKDEFNDFKKDVDGGVLNHRGWVMQERVLSRRIVHFTDGHMYWECGTVLRCDDYREIRCGRGEHYFIHDPDFPERLTAAGYFCVVGFVTLVCQQYAQFDISKKSDREVAMSGLMRRMESFWSTKYGYGVLELHAPRLLLWQRKSEINRSGRVTTYKGQQLPSWSWMTYSHIGFLKVSSSGGQLRVPRVQQLRFDSEGKDTLVAQVTVFKDCIIQGEGRDLEILNSNKLAVGICWYDTESKIHLEHCIVLAMDDNSRERDMEDAEKTYHVLLVREMPLQGRYERIGLGKIKARYVSRETWEGRLI